MPDLNDRQIRNWLSIRIDRMWKKFFAAQKGMTRDRVRAEGIGAATRDALHELELDKLADWERVHQIASDLVSDIEEAKAERRKASRAEGVQRRKAEDDLRGQMGAIPLERSTVKRKASWAIQEQRATSQKKTSSQKKATAAKRRSR